MTFGPVVRIKTVHIRLQGSKNTTTDCNQNLGHYTTPNEAKADLDEYFSVMSNDILVYSGEDHVKDH